MEAHEYAALFPMATEAELQEMAQDIKQRGLLNAIITLDGKILDGRNRARACEIAGVPARYQKYTGTDPLADVVSWNLHRRQLTTSQRAVVAVAIKPMFEERAKARMSAGGGDKKSGKANSPDPIVDRGEAREQAAKAVNVGGRIVQDAEHVKEHAPDLYEKVKAGEITVNKAKQEVKEREEKEEAKEAAPAKGAKRQHGSYEDWKRLRELCATVQEAIRQIDDLKVDVPHRIQARTLCENLADRLMKASQKLVGD